MSGRRLEIDEEEVKFLLVICSEEVLRCRKEQADVKFLQEAVLSQKRMTTAEGLAEKLASILDRIYEDDGLESRPDLN